MLCGGGEKTGEERRGPSWPVDGHQHGADKFVRKLHVNPNLIKAGGDVLAGASGTHTVYVCKYHQNFKLLLEGTNLQKYDEQLKTNHDVIREYICDSPTPNCYLESCCSACPGTDLEGKLRKIFDDHLIDKVDYQQRASTNRCCLENFTKDADELLVIFHEQLKKLLPHHFISKSQSKFYKEMKENLKEGESLTFSDGCPAQYKNRFNSINGSYHCEDFGFEDEWHFFATSHGKGACGGMPGTLKRCAYLDSLRKRGNKKISHPYEFYVWTESRIQEAQQDPAKEWKIFTAYVSKEQVQEDSDFLKKRFSSGIPASQCVISTKIYSNSIDFALVPVDLVRILPPLEDLAQAQYVAGKEKQNWILGQVQFFDPTTEEVFLKLMYKERSPSMWTVSENEQNEHSNNIEEILALASPTFSNGIYHLSKNDIIKIMWQLKVVKAVTIGVASDASTMAAVGATSCVG
ncbi:hypothetical protein FOCC_FOCC013979 [Frankliniella occidentalis]|nr:hypothetical protein FOCC_FOCC013979 [Frankliniella occidentalis]